MKTYTLLFFWLAGLVAALPAAGQIPDLSPGAQFSVITCGPGRDLYATFGHSAFRLRDPQNGIDWVYNYGTFDFHTPNFYVKFARGRLPYALSKQRFEHFLYTYQLESRWVREQLLDLSPAQERALLDFLEENHRPENRFYRYDFLYENCATKIPEVLEKVLGDSLRYQYGHLTGEHTFRELIHRNLRANSWSSFGIDLALGSPVDREARGAEYSFLPDYVKLQVGHALLEGSPLVGRERVILDLQLPAVPSYFTATPLFWVLLLLALTAVMTWIDFRHETRSRVFDFMLFFLTGASGLVIAFLWFLTDHNATQGNANLLWAFPLNLLPGFLLAGACPNARVLVPALWGLLGLLGLAAVVWITGIQAFSPLLIPVWVALALRYAYLISYFNRLP